MVRRYVARQGIGVSERLALFGVRAFLVRATLSVDEARQFMKIAKVLLEGTTPYSQSKHIDESVHPFKPKEGKDEYENRNWMHRMHVTSDGFVEIPSTCFANTLKSAARRLQIQVPGKGKTQYTKYFEAGIDVASSLILDTKAADVPKDRLFVPSDGRPGGGKRVFRNFPRIDKWSGTVTFYILDDMINESVFTQVLRSAGMLVGIGRFRPENRGFYGRFSVKKVEWIEDGDAVIAEAAE